MSRAPPAVDAVLAEIAERQHGLLRGFELAAAGVRPDAITRRVARGSLHRVFTGVYAARPREALA